MFKEILQTHFSSSPFVYCSRLRYRAAFPFHGVTLGDCYALSKLLFCMQTNLFPVGDRGAHA